MTEHYKKLLLSLLKHSRGNFSYLEQQSQTAHPHHSSCRPRQSLLQISGPVQPYHQWAYVHTRSSWLQTGTCILWKTKIGTLIYRWKQDARFVRVSVQSEVYGDEIKKKTQKHKIQKNFHNFCSFLLPQLSQPMQIYSENPQRICGSLLAEMNNIARCRKALCTVSCGTMEITTEKVYSPPEGCLPLLPRVWKYWINCKSSQDLTCFCCRLMHCGRKYTTTTVTCHRSLGRCL